MAALRQRQQEGGSIKSDFCYATQEEEEEKEEGAS